MILSLLFFSFSFKFSKGVQGVLQGVLHTIKTKFLMKQTKSGKFGIWAETGHKKARKFSIQTKD
jgi:hypothetical protein